MTRPEGSVLIWWRRCCRTVVRRGASVYRVADARSADLKSAVSQVCNLRIVGKIGRLGSDRCSADYKSAIRQVENLRYGKHIPAARFIPPARTRAGTSQRDVRAMSLPPLNRD